MRITRKALAAVAVAGAATVSVLAGAAPASAEGAGAAGFASYTGYGSGSTASFAIWSAEYDAERWAQLGGFNPIIDCWTTYSTSNQITPTYYTATVRISCFN